MGFFASLGSVIRTAALVGLAAFAAAGASAETIPGPPIGTTASDRAGAYCSLREGTSGNALAFAAGVAIVAIATRRRAGDEDA